MRIVIAHDHKFRRIEGELYSNGGLSEGVLSRYVEIFDNVVVIGRIVDSNSSTETLSKIENKKIEILDGFNKQNRIVILEIFKKSDAIIARLPSRLGNLAVKYAKKYNKPYLVEIVGCAWDSYWNHSLVGKLFAPYMYLRTRNLVKNSPFALYVTQGFLQSRYPCNGKTIGCSDVELTEFDEIAFNLRRTNIEEKFQETEACIIGTIGAIDVKYKGQKYIIESISKLKENGFNFEYHLVGGGNPEKLLKIATKCGVRDRVKIIGNIPHKDIFRFLDSIDIYAQPSSVEGLPRSLLEAMSRGCPSIGSRIGGIPEVLEDKSLFNNKNVDEISTILSRLNKKNMIESAEYSFKKAKMFQKEKLDKMRYSFYMLLRDQAKVINKHEIQ